MLLLELTFGYLSWSLCFISTEPCLVSFSCVDVNMADYNLHSSEIDRLIDDDALILIAILMNVILGIQL